MDKSRRSFIKASFGLAISTAVLPGLQFLEKKPVRIRKRYIQVVHTGPPVARWRMLHEGVAPVKSTYEIVFKV